jgi:hypothetical protein
MSEPVVSFQAFLARQHSSYWVGTANKLEDLPAVAALIDSAREYLEYLEYVDFQDEEEGRATLDEAPIPSLIRLALYLWGQGILTGDPGPLTVGYALLEKAVHRLDRQAEEEFD